MWRSCKAKGGEKAYVEVHCSHILDEDIFFSMMAKAVVVVVVVGETMVGGITTAIAISKTNAKNQLFSMKLFMLFLIDNLHVGLHNRK